MMQHMTEYSNSWKAKHFFFKYLIIRQVDILTLFLSFFRSFHFSQSPFSALVLWIRWTHYIDSFVNSQEWTLSRSVPELRLGIVGSINSGKSALVHRYLTGSYMQEESPEGGRFKKEIFIDNQSYLLLIRDEGGSPEIQVNKRCVL